MISDIEKQITRFAITSRIIIILLQAVANILIPDHDASDIFITPANDIEKNIFDQIILTLFGGLIRWDGQYFIHISIYGYTHENTLAFFPLFPIFINSLSRVLEFVLPFLNILSISIMSSLIVNFIFFILSVKALYKLTLKTVNSDAIAYKAAILFCLNPANIFFTASYSESLFTYFTFSAMLYKSIILNALFISLSAATRSNGLINIGFLVYKQIKKPETLGRFCLSIIISFLGFLLFQFYSYYEFCISDSVVVNTTEDMNNYILAGSMMGGFCNSKLPYLYVQERYWNVGIMNYYEIKQIPNFLLALPIIYLTLRMSFQYFKNKLNLLFTLGLYDLNDIPSFRKHFNCTCKYFTDDMFVFVAHYLILSIFCVCVIHVQVTTRMLCSSSPVLYWLASIVIRQSKYKRKRTPRGFSKVYDFLPYYWNDWKVKFIAIYFISYSLIGTVLFSNFYPWT